MPSPRHVALLLLAATAACSRPRTQVVAPVRTDSVIARPLPTRGALPVVGARHEPARTVASDPFFPLDRDDVLPGPDRVRGAGGAPGPDYWQQRASYTIAAALDTSARSVSGTVAIRYVNASPDTLRHLWLQLDQNLHRPDSRGSALRPAGARWRERGAGAGGAGDGVEGGFSLRDVTVDGRAVAPHVDDTMMRLDLARPLAPRGGTLTVRLRFSFRVPEDGAGRMGRDGALYEIAQWHPRMAVYDDVRGWNTDPYLGQGEFHLEYGDFDVSLTVPAGYVVAATGTLRNEREVLGAAQRERLARARASERVVHVVTADEAVARPAPGTKTWRFTAERVRDFAWAAAPDFRWDATSWNGVLVQAFFQPRRTGKAWDQAAEQTRWSIRTYSELVLPYPYPQATSVAGPVGGMAYPMLAMVPYGRNDDPNSIFGALDHEQAHAWFPTIVGSDERRHAWMDEGLATYLNTFSRERRNPGEDVVASHMASWREAVARGVDEPVVTRPDHLHRTALGALAQRKPALLLLTLRNHVVGAEAFDRAVRVYAERWAFRHPTPADFFRTIEDVSGVELDWFWRGFLFSNDVLDLAVGPVSMRTDSAGVRVAQIPVRMNGSIPFPVAMRLRLANGTTRDVRLPVDVFAHGAEYAFETEVPAAVTGVRLWPDPTVPDWDPSNDVWGDAPPANVRGPVTVGW